MKLRGMGRGRGLSLVLIKALFWVAPCALGAQVDTLRLGYYSHTSRTSAWKTYAKEGCNLLVVYGSGQGTNWGTTLDAARDAGLKIILDLHHHPPRWHLKITTEQIRKLVQQYRDHPALYGYYIADEPESPWNNEPPEVFQPIYDALKAADPSHPVTICMNHRFPDQYATIFDLLLTDHYPNWSAKNNQPKFNAMVRASYRWWRDALEFQSRHHKQGLIAVGLAGGDGTGNGLRDLTDEEYRFHVFCGVVLGVKGFVFYWDAPTWLTKSVRDKTTRMIAQMRAIGDQMAVGVGVTEDPRITVSQPVTKVRYRYGVTGTTHVLLTVNISRWDSSDEGETLNNVRFTLPRDLRVRQVEVLDENRVLPVTDGTFSDTFKRFEVHVYRFTAAEPSEGGSAVTRPSREAL